MAKAATANNGHPDADEEDEEETKSLLSSAASTSADEDAPAKPSSPPPEPAPRTPRTTNRVRFQLDDPPRARSEDRTRYSDSQWVDDEDFLSSPAAAAAGGRRGSLGQHRLPLLTGIEAPSITLASAEDDFDAEDLLESARPKSGMRSAFMNMANSIM